MNRTGLHSLDPSSARKKIAAAKSNQPFMAALLDRGHRGYRDVVEQWTRLHDAAFSESQSPAAGRLGRLGSEERRLTPGVALGGALGGREEGNGTRADGAARQLKSRLQSPGGTGRVQGSDGGGGGIPVINKEADRIQALLEDAPARFEIAENPDADPNYGAWRALHPLGVIAVRRHESIIEREANAQGVDADLVRAIMYVENAHGGIYGHIGEAFDQSESLLPMNIKPDPWSTIAIPSADLGDSETNIRTAVTLISRIWDRVDNPTPAKVASIWNFTGRESVNDYGQRVQDVYERKPWIADFDSLNLSP